MERAPFISLEGGEGSGKSTQIGRLKARLEAMGKPVLMTREPGGAPGAEEIRQLLVTGAPGRWDAMTEALLHFAARRDHLLRTINPARAKGIWVISDRFADSTMAYQGVAQKLGAPVVRTLYDLVVKQDGPDLSLILDLDVEEGLRRASGRPTIEDRYERMGRGFHEALRQAYLEIARADAGRCALIDASGSQDEVHERIFEVVARRLIG